MDEVDDTVGELVPREAKRRLSNFKQIARISGLSHSHVSRALRGKKGLTFHVAAVIAQAADVRLDHVYNFILRSKDLTIRTRKTRKPRAKSVITPITREEGFPEPPIPPLFPIEHSDKYIFP